MAEHIAVEEQGPQTLPTDYWYREAGAVDRWFYGVFEGGGAKGVAYSGTLLAMKEMNCWFKGVAGASAGAITAALIASGLSPEELERATDDALKQVQTGLWSGLRRLHGATGYFPSDRLLDWLEELLKKQVARQLSSASDSRVTFLQLYDATGIELNVVAADLSLRRQIIFSHFDTPACSVAEAVVASSSIPFAFPSRLLQVHEDGKFYHHTIVDGGVWSNFPLFIFEDGSFRRFYGRKPADIDPREVLGFYLKEEDEQPPPRGSDIAFVESPTQVRAREWFENRREPVKSSGLLVKVLAWALYPFYLLGRLVELNVDAPRGRWPTLRSRPARYLVQSLNATLGGISVPFFAIATCFIFVYVAQNLLVTFGMDLRNGLVATDWMNPAAVGVRIFVVILLLLVSATVILVTFVGVIAVLANFVLLRAARTILYGLITTYVAGPGTPAWVDQKRNVIGIWIPASTTALTFGMQPNERRDLIETAHKTTINRLTEILREFER